MLRRTEGEAQSRGGGALARRRVLLATRPPGGQIKISDKRQRQREKQRCIDGITGDQVQVARIPHSRHRKQSLNRGKSSASPYPYPASAPRCLSAWTTRGSSIGNLGQSTHLATSGWRACANARRLRSLQRTRQDIWSCVCVMYCKAVLLYVYLAL